MRKLPQQERARATVEAILIAAGQLFVEVGVQKANTTRIAERAGVSVGSLYQYFPNKQSIILALADQVGTRQHAASKKLVAMRPHAPTRQMIRELIKTIFEAKRVEPELSRLVFQEKTRIDESQPMGPWIPSVEKLVRDALEARKNELAVDDLEVATFTVVHAVHGVISSMLLLGRQDLLENSKLVEDTSRMVELYLLVRD